MRLRSPADRRYRMLRHLRGLRDTLDLRLADSRAQGETRARMASELYSLEWALMLVDVLKERGELAQLDLDVRSRLAENTRERVEG